MDGLKLKHDGWVVIADGHKALFLYNEGDEVHPNLEVFREMEQESPLTRDQGTDRPGRVHDGVGGHKSAVQDTDWHELDKERFAKDISERLYKYAHAGRFDKLILVAPPGVLGDMRKELHPEVLAKLLGEVPKTLTNHPVHEIEKLILH